MASGLRVRPEYRRMKIGSLITDYGKLVAKYLNVKKVRYFSFSVSYDCAVILYAWIPTKRIQNLFIRLEFRLCYNYLFLVQFYSQKGNPG
jgi:hypothetical protein